MPLVGSADGLLPTLLWRSQSCLESSVFVTAMSRALRGRRLARTSCQRPAFLVLAIAWRGGYVLGPCAAEPTVTCLLRCRPDSQPEHERLHTSSLRVLYRRPHPIHPSPGYCAAH